MWLAALFVASFAIAIGSWSEPVAGAGELDPADLRHQLRVTFCLEQRKKRFYQTENLEDMCALKVAFFSEYVSMQWWESNP